MIGFYDYTVIATYLATIFSVVGMFRALDGDFMAAIVCLLVSGLLDTVDGRIARTKKNRTDSEKRFGIQIDSLNDVICFGVLPAVIAFSACREKMDNVPVWYTATLCFFVLCGLIRLAYFNVMEEERQQKESCNRTCYQGLPITASTLLFPLICLLCTLCGNQPLVIALGLFITGVLYISPLEVPKPHTVGIVILSCIGFLELGALVLLFVR